MVPVLEAVPNFSEGRDPAFLDAVIDAARRHGVDVLDGSRDPDHHRSVVTWVGDPASVEAAAVAVAEVALERVDLRTHQGIHPRIGAVDVLPFVPLYGLEMPDAVASARRVGRRLADRGMPVFFYGAASSPPGRTLAEIRRGGFETLVPAFPEDRRPDLDGGRSGAHPTAGAVCVGARPLLLAWNIQVEGVPLEALRALASKLRETGGGFPGLRVLALTLERAGVQQVSMNLEDVEHRSPLAVFEAVEAAVRAAGGRILGTEVVGMIPGPLVFEAAVRRLGLFDADPSRFLPTRLVEHLGSRMARDLDEVLAWHESAGDVVPPSVRAAAARLGRGTLTQAGSGDDG